MQMHLVHIHYVLYQLMFLDVRMILQTTLMQMQTLMMVLVLMMYLVVQMRMRLTLIQMLTLKMDHVNSLLIVLLKYLKRMNKVSWKVLLQ